MPHAVTLIDTLKRLLKSRGMAHSNQVREFILTADGAELLAGGGYAQQVAEAYTPTREALAGLLGVQRTTVNAVVRGLQDEGLIVVKRVSINEIAASTKRPGDVLGMHFFSPANVMKLLEVVRGAKTQPDVLVTAMQLAKRLRDLDPRTTPSLVWLEDRLEDQATSIEEVVRRAQQVELVDITPEALRRRMAHGNVYPAERVDAALSHYFRVGNLAALRELALLWLADRVDEGLERYRRDHDIESTTTMHRGSSFEDETR